MRILLAFFKKEILQIRRSRMMISQMFLVPLIQLVVLAYAANPIMRNIRIGFIDNDHSFSTRELIRKVGASGYFVRVADFDDWQQAQHHIEARNVDVVMEFPAFFERDLVKHNNPTIGIKIDAVNAMKAGLANNYLNGIIQDWTLHLPPRFINRQDSIEYPHVQELVYSQWYNRRYDHKTFIMPGILTILISTTAVFVASGNIVKEKELGNIEQINVTPVTKPQFIAGKLIPFYVIGLIQLTLGLIIINGIFRIETIGSIALLYGVFLLYLMLMLGLGFIVSTISDNQIQAMLSSMFFFNVFVLLSGYITPVQSMPEWAQKINMLNPIAYMIELVRLIMLKGSTFADAYRQIISLGVFAVIVNAIAIISYRKSSR